jgi:LPXTG-motif cell wall-anchored protein
VSPLGFAEALASGVQGGGARPPAAHTSDMLELGAVLLGLALLALGTALVIRRRRRRARPVADQWGALTVMGELCPHGWQAQITLYGWGAPVPSDAPASRAPLIELEWKQFDEQTGQVAVARRAWAETIPEALQVMVEDRRTDLTLEQIEQSAGGEDLWSS